jgi:uncharacterized protein (DUF1330 family)
LKAAWDEIMNEDPEKRDAKQVGKKPKVVQLFGGRQLIRSDQLSKINQNNWTQSRTFVITEDKIFNIVNTTSKREMAIASLDGLSRSMLGKKPEFTIHFKKEYDYRFACDLNT